jgi:hypothetical protein
MGASRQIGRIKPGTYPNSAVLTTVSDMKASNYGQPLWYGDMTVVIGDKWATVTSADGTVPAGLNPRYLRSTNKSLQVYVGMSVEQAKAERATNKAFYSLENDWGQNPKTHTNRRKSK